VVVAAFVVAGSGAVFVVVAASGGSGVGAGVVVACALSGGCTGAAVVGGVAVVVAEGSVFGDLLSAPLKKRTPPARPPTTASPARIVAGLFFAGGAIMPLARGASVEEATGAAEDGAETGAVDATPEVAPDDVMSDPKFEGRGRSGDDEMSFDGGARMLSTWKFGST
jgi:hypothetical protein